MLSLLLLLLLLKCLLSDSFLTSEPRADLPSPRPLWRGDFPRLGVRGGFEGVTDDPLGVAEDLVGVVEDLGGVDGGLAGLLIL